MSKRLPYYQSEPAEYLAGDIMFCTFGAQGVFSIIRALYWQKECNLTLAQAKRRLKNADQFIDELIEEGIIKVIDGEIFINFLDEQFEKASGKSKTNSENGKKGAAKRWAKKGIDSESIATPLNNDSESIALREDKIREDKIREEKNILFISFWDLYNKKTGKDKTKTKFMKLPIDIMAKIIKVVPDYVRLTPDKKFRKDPATYLSGKHWEDELEIKPVRTQQSRIPL